MRNYNEGNDNGRRFNNKRPTRGDDSRYGSRSYNNSERPHRINGRVNSNRPSINNSFNKDDKASKVNDLIAKQTRNLDIVESIVKYLNDFLTTSENRVSMVDLLRTINNQGFNQEDTKAISQFNYMLVDLANAQKNQYIYNSPERVDVRVKYIKERFVTSYRRELYDRINTLFNDNALFVIKPKED